MNLKDAKGYRSSYINNLNDAVKRHHIIGGDVTPIENDFGTHLLINRPMQKRRFALSAGIAKIKDNELWNTICVGDGAFYVNGTLVTLRNATNTMYFSDGIVPIVSGWASKGPNVSSWSKCDVVILRYREEYYMAFRYDEQDLTALISEDLSGDDVQAVEEILRIGTFNNVTNSLTQYIDTDIFYGAEGIKKNKSWQIISQYEDVEKEDGEEGETELKKVFYIVFPQWQLLIEKTVLQNEGTKDPKPTELLMAPIHEKCTYTVENATCGKLEDILDKESEGDAIYAIFDHEGNVTVKRMPLQNENEPKYPNKILVAQVIKNNEGEVTGYEQVNSGVFSTAWSETEPFYIENQGSSGIVFHAEAPIDKPEGTTINRSRIWQATTYVDGTEICHATNLKSEDTPSFEEVYPASFYGSYIYRYCLRFDNASQSILIERQTTAVLNVAVDELASFIDTPFVQRIEVTYPETPLEQGSVDSVGGTVKVLASRQITESKVNLFKTESIDTTKGNIIQTESGE